MKYILRNTDIKENYLETLLKERKILDIPEYINPSIKSVLNPTYLLNMEIAAKLLLQHLTNNSKIFILPDSDQDGNTSAAIIWQYIKRIFPNANLSFKIHNGKQHGLEDMMFLADSDYKLVIVPDAGSNDFEYHKQLRDKGIDVIVLDHHDAEKLSDDALVVNNQLSPDYANKGLSGAGVVYKFCKYLDTICGVDYADDYLDLAAIGIIGDMMSLIPLENRYIITKGLKNIKNPFIKALVDKQAYSIGDTSKITPTSIAFYIAPLINALIRVGSTEEKEQMFKAFTEGEQIVASTKRGAKGESETLGDQVARNCVNARSRQNRAKDKAIEQLEVKIFNDNLADNKIIIVEVDAHDDLDSTLTGLVAMQLTAKFKKPVIVARENKEGFLRGSARGMSKSGLKDLRQFFIESGFFEYAEGHASAHGVSILKNKISRFTEYANDKLKDINFNEGVYEVNFIRNGNSEDLYDLAMEIGAYNDLWGQGNPEPLIVTTDIYIKKSDIKLMGAAQDTLKFEVNGVTFIKFKAENLINETMDKDNIKITVIGKANLNAWGGRVSPQIFIEDFECEEGSIYDF